MLRALATVESLLRRYHHVLDAYLAEIALRRFADDPAGGLSTAELDQMVGPGALCRGV